MIQLKYAFTSEGDYNAADIAIKAQQIFNPPIVYQAVKCAGETSGNFIKLNSNGVKILSVKPAEDKQGFIIRLVNLNKVETMAGIEFPSKKISAAWRCSTQEEKITSLIVKVQKLNILLQPREISSFRIE